MSAQASESLSGQYHQGPQAGRRRARLIQGSATAANPPALSLADVQALQDDPSPPSRAALAGKFGRQYDHLVEGDTRTLAQAVLELLARDAEKTVRQAVAEAAAASANLPPGIARRLANDDLEVARPILTYSPVLTDDHLVEIVRTRAVPYALAVASRERLSESLSEVLADTTEAEVVAALTGNPGAELSVATLRRIADEYRDDRAVQDRLIRRPALPYELVDQLITALGERLEWDLIRQRRIGKAEARQLMTAARERAALSTVAREQEERSIERELRHRFTAGDLGPEDIVRFLRDGEIARLEAGLALLAGLDLLRVRTLLYGMNKRGFAALCARAGFGAPHYIALRMALDLAEQRLDGSDPESAYASEAIAAAQQQFDQIRSDRAQMSTWFGG
ncbi:MAG TPA: DUF2336 domain-containing protein [Geminicoccaceae bacterium]|jgi:uncharacterized protein (DUF2336 family)|nr:DUF2336 domain-containing protein [Geminicoccaceae bacterium]